MKTYTLLMVTAVMGFVGCDSGQAAARPAAETRESAVSVKTLTPGALDILRAALKDNDAHLRAPAIEVVVETGQKELMSEVIRLMDDPTVAVRFAAVVAAGDMQCFGCEQNVRKRLTDADDNVRLAAAYSLIKLNDPQHYAMLREGIRNSDQTVRANAALLLGKAGDKADVNLLYSLLKDDTAEDKVMIQAVESIARLKDIRIYRSKLWALMISEYADDRVMGIRGMAELGTIDAKNAIATMLTDDVQEVRLFAAEQLGRLGDPSGKKEVADYLSKVTSFDQPEFGTLTAVMAIGRIGTPELTAYLPKALHSASPMMRLTAAQSVLRLTMPQ